jgi:serine/threonine protein kinase
LKYGREVDWWLLGIVMYIMMVGHMLFEGPMTFFYEVRHKSAQFPTYLTRNAVSILNGASIINIKAQALGVCYSLFNAVFFHS